METSAVSRPLHVLLTGPPVSVLMRNKLPPKTIFTGIGKTTICKKIASILEKKGGTFNGFYTEEVRDGSGCRIGFDIVKVTNPGEKLSLARLKSLPEAQTASKYQVGNYRIFLANFETIALPTLNLNTDILFIDEIGKMELFSKDFKKKVTDILFDSSKKVSVIGTIPQINKVPQQHAALFKKLHEDERIKILNVSQGNRNHLPVEIIRYFS